MLNGCIIEYRLIFISSRSFVEVVYCRGIILLCVVGGFRFYIVYNFVIEVCINGGCGWSNDIIIFM